MVSLLLWPHQHYSSCGITTPPAMSVLLLLWHHYSSCHVGTTPTVVSLLLLQVFSIQVFSVLFLYSFVSVCVDFIMLCSTVNSKLVDKLYMLQQLTFLPQIVFLLVVTQQQF